MTHGIDLCDVNVQAAGNEGPQPRVFTVTDSAGAASWPGFALHDGAGYSFGQAAEDGWFVHPRRVCHTFWSRLGHDPSGLAVSPRSPSNSELAFYFLRDFLGRLARVSSPARQVVLAVPGSFMKDEATEEEKIGILLGMAAELKLPLAGIVDQACAALCDPRAPRFNPARPVLVLDLHLHTAELSLVVAANRLERRGFLQIPQSGLAELLKHLTATMANRFLRQTAFDVMADGRIEQLFFAQTRTFLTEGAPEFRYQLNTARRGYEMLVKREHLVSDSQTFTLALVQALKRFTEQHALAPAMCVIALSERTAWLPQLENRLRAAGFVRFLRLPPAAAAAGAASVGASHFSVPADLGDVPAVTSLPVEYSRNRIAAHWEVTVQKGRASEIRPGAPTHALLEGLGSPLGGLSRFVIGAQGMGADLPLPETFNPATDCSVALSRDGERWWFSDPTHTENGIPARVEIEAGDRLTFRCGGHVADVLFAHCRLPS
jgi:hypothetical protein